MSNRKRLRAVSEGDDHHEFRLRPSTACVRHRLTPNPAACHHDAPLQFTDPDDEALYQRQTDEQFQQSLGDTVRFFRRSNWQQRRLLLSALLMECCVPQLSYLSQTVPTLSRIDFLLNLPAELALRVLSFLDARSLCRAARVSKTWRSLADCDVIWHRLCEQHIEKKCTKCGWNLPLMPIQPPQPVVLTTCPSNAPPAQEITTNNDASSSLQSRDVPALIPAMRWKTVYAERMLCEKNWRLNRFRKSVFKGHTGAVLCTQMLQRRLATGSRDTTVRLWNLDTGKCERILNGHEDDVTAIQFDKTKLISGSLDGSLKVWNLGSGMCIRTLRGHASGVTTLHYDHQVLVSGSIDRCIRVWKMNNGQSFTLTGHQSTVNKVLLVNETSLISCSDDTTIRIWDWNRRECLYQLQDQLPSGAIPSINLWQSQPNFLFSVSVNNIITVWDYKKKEVLERWYCHVDGFRCLASNSLRLVAGGNDGSIKLYDIQDRAEMHYVINHESSINAISVSDTLIACGSEDSTVMLLDFSPTNK